MNNSLAIPDLANQGARMDNHPIYRLMDILTPTYNNHYQNKGGHNA